MILEDSCIIWFHLDCIMQLKKSYYIATNVGSKESATTFGDLPDCSAKITFWKPGTLHVLINLIWKTCLITFQVCIIAYDIIYVTSS